MPSKPWYTDGLQFSCTGSGHCCSGGPGYVWVNTEEILELAEALSLTPEQFGLNYLRRVDGEYSLIEKANSDCIFLEDKKCTVYEARPVQCRTYPFWPELLKSKAAWEKETCHCKGMNQGMKHTLAAIRKQLEEVNEAGDKP